MELSIGTLVGAYRLGSHCDFSDMNPIVLVHIYSDIHFVQKMRCGKTQRYSILVDE